jgi:hypothetical protein
MNSHDDNDIARLFAQFGGDPDTYQEIASVAAAREARARWPVLTAFDPLARIAAPAVGPDDAAVVAQALRPAESPHEADDASPRAQFMAPRPKSFSREIPKAFLAPIAPLTAAAEFAVVPMTQARVAPAPQPSAMDHSDSAAPAVQAASAAPASDPQAGHVVAPIPATVAGPALEPAPASTLPDMPAPSTAADPFRRLAAMPAAGVESQRLPDLFKRLLSS